MPITGTAEFTREEVGSRCAIRNNRTGYGVRNGANMRPNGGQGPWIRAT
jgi:hypothetical protein